MHFTRKILDILIVVYSIDIIFLLISNNLSFMTKKKKKKLSFKICYKIIVKIL